MTKEPVEFNEGGLTLRGNFYQAGNPKKLAILFLHGWTGTPNEAAAEFLTGNGFTCLTFSLSGHGQSDGDIKDQTRGKSLKEILSAHDLFKSKLPMDVLIGAVGNSYGGYFAAILSGERPLACIQMRVPANYKDERFDELQMPQSPTGGNKELWEWRLLPQAPDATKSLRAVHKFNGPIQIIEAENDDHVPRQTVQNYINALKDKAQLDYHFMKDWPHSLGDDPERNRQYQEMLLNWLNKINEQI